MDGSKSEIELNWWPELAAKVAPFRGEGTALAAPKATLAKTFDGVLDPSKLAGVRAEAAAAGTLWKAAIERASPKFGKRVDDLIDRWFVDRGAAHAVELVRWLFTDGGVFDIGTPVFDIKRNVASENWVFRVRAHLAHATATDYSAALAWATESLASWQVEGIPHYAIASVYACLFPDHRPFFDAALAAPATEPIPMWIFASVTKEADVPAIMNQERRMFWDGDYGLTLAARFGVRGYALLREHKWDDVSESYGIAISPYAGNVVAADMLRLLADRSTRKCVGAYFAHNPTLVPVLVEATRTGDKSIRKAAAKLVEELQKA